MKLSRSLAAVTAVASAVVLAFVPAAQAATTLVVGGASSVATIVGDCKVAYTAKTGDSFAYASSSSGQGQKDMESGKNDYAYSDSAHLTSQSGTAIPATEIHIPAWVWPIGVQYKDFAPGRTIAISAKNLSLIFAGKIKKWNDPLLQADNNRTISRTIFKTDGAGNAVKDAKGNPIVLNTVKVTQKITLPNQPITVIYRGDSSGTTGNLLAAFSKIDPTNWPTASVTGGTKVFASSDAKAAVLADPIHFQGTNTSAGVAQLAAKTPYSITYAETNFASLNSLGLANIINAHGDLVQPNDAAAAAQVASADIASNGVVTLDYLNKGAGIYPFTVVTYALVLTKYADATKAAAVKNAVEWHAFSCPDTAPNDGFIKIDKTSALGVKISSLIAKIGA
jgi:phosphate transport system substrate-binding protein